MKFIYKEKLGFQIKYINKLWSQNKIHYNQKYKKF